MEDGEEDFLDGSGGWGEGDVHMEWNGKHQNGVIATAVMRHKVKVVDGRYSREGNGRLWKHDFGVENVFGYTMSMRSHTTYPSPYRLPRLPIYPIFAISPNESHQLHPIPSHSTVAFFRFTSKWLIDVFEKKSLVNMIHKVVGQAPTLPT